MLEVEGLTVAYGGVLALDSVSLSVPAHGITAVLGPNGAGKSTLLRAIAGLVRPRAGSIRFQGSDLTHTATEELVRAGISMVPEGGGVIRELTIEENLRLAQLWRRDRPDLKRALAEVFALFPPLESRRRLPAFSLSGGERQMLAIGRALVSRPDLLLLDEPSLGLAPMLVSLIMRTIQSLRRDRGLTVLLVEQNARSALSIADDAVLISSGRVVAARSAEELAQEEELWHAYLGY